MPKFTKGTPKPKSSGRKKGTPNKFTSIKQSFLDAFKDKRVGSTEGLILWILESKRNRAMFYQWITKFIPTSVTGGEDKEGKSLPIKLIIENNANTNTDKS